MIVISVARAGKEIGDFDLHGVREGLGSGYFLPDDYGWYAGLKEWKSLAAVVQSLTTNSQLSDADATVARRERSPSQAQDPTLLYTLFRGRGPAKITLIRDAKYFYRLKDAVEGPFNKLEMRALVRKKIVEPETMILCPATQEWIPCERFPELPKPAVNKLLHFEKDQRFSALIQEIPPKMIEHVTGKLDEPDLYSWLDKRIRESGYRCPDYDEGTINDLVYEDRLRLIIKTNRQTWAGYIQYRRGGGSALGNMPELIGF